MVVGLKHEMSVESGAASVSTGALTVEPSTQVHVYMYVHVHVYIYMMYETNVLSVLCVRACVCVYTCICVQPFCSTLGRCMCLVTISMDS